MVQQLQAHRGTLILVFGILGVMGMCVFFGVAAWVMGNGDLRQMDQGTMDPEGRSLTQAGRICGIISVVLSVIYIGVGILLLIFVFGAAAVSNG